MQIDFSSSLARLVSAVIISASLAGCGGGGGGGGGGGDAQTQTGAGSQPAAAIQVPSPGVPAPPIADPTQANRAPSIEGTAITTVTAGQGYSFVPSTADADGDPLQFSISSMPSWATFDVATGRLWGAPTNAQSGSYEEIEISVSDGALSAKLPQFAITVMASVATNHAVTVAWQAPTLNTDGTTLTDLSGYRIVYGDQPGTYTQSIDLANAGLASYLVENLSAGRYYFALVARNGDGIESEPSMEVSINLG
jgi:putative Ig domain-containing protein